MKIGINYVIFLLEGTLLEKKIFMYIVNFFFYLYVLMCKLDFMNFVIFRNFGNEGFYFKLFGEKGRSL